MRRLVPRSLHGRMVLVSVVATLVALGIAGSVIAAVLGRFVTEGLDRRLDAEVLTLASVVDGAGRVDRARLEGRAGALAAGPGWQWRIAGPDGVIGSADFPALGDPLPPPGPGPGPERGPRAEDRGGLRAVEGRGRDGDVHARAVTVPTSRGPVTIAAAAPREVIDRPIRAALAPLLLALAAVAGVLTAAMLVQLRVGLKPLRRLQGEVAEIRAGRRERVDEDQPAELRPLATELNALTADNAAALATARLSAANLAHALKTPVAALAIEVRDEPHRAGLVARIDGTIRHHLARARAAAINRRSATPLRVAAEDVATTVRMLRGGDAPTVTLAVDADVAVAVDPQDLDELLGNLLENAVRHARAAVTLSGSREGRMVCIEVADDGPGIPADARARIAQPGVRLDERGDGHGFGLAIVAELASLYGGSFALEDAASGGLLVRITLSAA